MNSPDAPQPRSRSFLVVLGGILAFAGMGTGASVSVPGLHDALTISDAPLEMSWHELIQIEWTDNARIRLIDVELSNIGTPDVAEHAGQIDSNFQVDETIDAPIAVIPAGSDADGSNTDSMSAKVFVLRSAEAIQAAVDETQSQGTLTGRFRRIKKTAFNTSDSEANPTNEIHYVFEPLGEVFARSEAMEWFAISLAAVAIGLVICGAGGPSLLCCIFFTGPSMLSLLGYPLRYGRSGRIVKIAYALAGGALVANGYRQLVIEGRIGQLDGNMFICVLGFLQLSIGTSSLLGVVASLLTRKAKASPETTNPSSMPSATAKNSVQTKMTYKKACGMERCDAVSICDYLEKQASKLEAGKLSPNTNRISQSLSALGFGEPQAVQWRDSDTMSFAALQIGCQGVVVAEISETGPQPWTRLISVLKDGMTVITLPPGIVGTASKRLGTEGFYGVSLSQDIDGMMKTHLENTINMAERRNTTLVSIETVESAQVSQLASRVFAKVQTQYGEAHWKVGDASYGRFRFPPAPVRVLEGVVA